MTLTNFEFELLQSLIFVHLEVLKSAFDLLTSESGAAADLLDHFIDVALLDTLSFFCCFFLFIRHFDRFFNGLLLVIEFFSVASFVILVIVS